ncbi:sugar ABC transporter substrate-binding protein [Streptomyces sp. S.PNR 29]|uniref:ABC transporter substrate-binding protein n=1 Tax=Streptomyces sp. S.PNR 29 TaxID=2973805 RepID=UPI0025AFCB65|nr:sugar ABC transporter substrate-binding protein [Streptomyces sp. S.PNR 29]MDN0197806.1 sugar ABC transporter substrate-binding protein [Streptomyces sp. S.PNR 29]
MALTGALTLSLTAGCANGDSVGAGRNTVTYWLWDANQLPAYQACAKDFEKENPGLQVKITQMGWSDYWTKLTASFIAGTQPDVFTDHIQKFGQFADLKVLEPLDDLSINPSDYQSGLAGNWMGQDGHRYGAPKDWDTVALFYNQKMTKAAGLTAEQLNNLDWNPKDGGTFEKAVAHLTIDRNGKRGDEPGFDKNHVKVYGLATGGAGDGDGQTTWSNFAASAGWNYTDKKRWGTKYQYDSKTFQSTIKWFFDLAKKGYMPPLTDYSEGANPANAQLASGKAAMAFDGAWMISTYYGFKNLKVGTAVTPAGPTGKRATMMNGLADSVTKNARNKPGALKWVKYLSSDKCQKTVGSYGIVFPATPAGTEAAVAAYKKKGIDVTAFTEPVADKKDFTTFSFPITNYAADVYALMHPAMQDVYGNGKSVSSLDQTNDQINLILSQ